MRNDFETVMKTFSLHFSFGEVFLHSAKSKQACIPLSLSENVPSPLPCYGKRFFSVTPQVGEITTEYAPLWQIGTLPKYAFNAKELDEESGMYYFEARYYKLPVFTSRDPMMDQKPWLTPYHYCSNNPVGRVDPSGMFDDWVEKADGT
ncbi:MAG: RHS repeat-associated core domain-containing protein, partial [Bacteroidales bacterium]|nr:RHS repeat-associated core domain-containing protein [Bacteroidales bacterium]